MSVSWISLGFAGAFLVSPLAILLWYAHSPGLRERIAGEEGQAAYRAARNRCVLITGVSLALFVVLAIVPEDPGWVGSWGVALACFHIAWWTTCAPLLNRGREPVPTVPGDLRARSTTSTRVATLSPRRVGDVIPTWWWAIPVGLFVAGTGWVVARVAETGDGLTWAITGPVSALAFLLGYGWWARHAAIGPQDLSCAVDPARYEAACDAFRRFIARGVFWMMTLAVVAFLGSAVAVMAVSADPASMGRVGGWTGGGLGALLGILGGVFGTIGTKKRMELENIRTGTNGDSRPAMA